MYPDLKAFRKKLNNAGPWLFGDSLNSLFQGVFFVMAWGTLEGFDSEYDKIPWIIEILFTISVVYIQFNYLNRKLRLGLENEKDQIKSIINIEDIKNSLLIILFIRLQLRYLLLLRIPYLILIFSLLPSLNNTNLTETIFIYILHTMFLCYDHLSYKDTIDKLTKNPLPLKANKNYSAPKKDINNTNEDNTEKNTNPKKINEFDSKKLITKLLKKK